MKNNPFPLCWISGTLTAIIIAMIYNPAILKTYQTCQTLWGSALNVFVLIAGLVIIGFILGLGFAMIQFFLMSEKYSESRKLGNIWTGIIAALFAAASIFLI